MRKATLTISLIKDKFYCMFKIKKPIIPIYFILKMISIFLAINTTCYSMETKPESSFGCRWTSTLNFSDGKLISGPKGNIKIISEINGDDGPKYTEEQYNIDNIHCDLAKLVFNAGLKDYNVVVAGMSTIFQAKNGNFYACYTPLMSSRKATLVFVSGFSDNIPPTQYFRYISTRNSFLNDANQADKKLDEDKQISFSMLFDNFYKRNFLKVLSKGDVSIVEEYKKLWKNNQLNAKQELFKQLLLEQSEQEEILENNIESLFKLMQININKSRKNVGSIVDSEQLLLHYKNSTKALENVFILQKMQYESYRNDKIDKFALQNNETIIALLKKKFNDETDKLKQLNNFAQENLKQLDCLKKEKDAKEIQNIFYIGLHVHTTREMCKCCAASIYYELLTKAGFENCLNDKTELFFSVSCNEEIAGKDNDIRPVGIEKIFNKELLDFSKKSVISLVHQKFISKEELQSSIEEKNNDASQLSDLFN